MEKIYATITLKIVMYPDTDLTLGENVEKLGEAFDTVSFDGDVLDYVIEITDSK